MPNSDYLRKRSTRTVRTGSLPRGRPDAGAVRARQKSFGGGYPEGCIDKRELRLLSRIAWSTGCGPRSLTHPKWSILSCFAYTEITDYLRYAKSIIPLTLSPIRGKWREQEMRKISQWG